MQDFIPSLICYLYHSRIIHLGKNTFNTIIVESVYPLSYSFVIDSGHLSYFRYCIAISSKKYDFSSVLYVRMVEGVRCYCNKLKQSYFDDRWYNRMDSRLRIWLEFDTSCEPMKMHSRMLLFLPNLGLLWGVFQYL